MGILTRFKDIVSANVNELLDKCENPEKMVDEYLRKALDDLADVKKETASVMATEESAKRKYDDLKEDTEKYASLAEKAVLAGNDGDAKTFLAKKKELSTLLESAKQNYDVAHSNAERMRQLHDKLTQDIESLKVRRDNIKAQMAVAKTQERINNAGEAGKKIKGTMGAFERMEQKAQRKLDEANAMEALNKSSANSALEEAEARYNNNNAEIDDELAALKAKLGK